MDRELVVMLLMQVDATMGKRFRSAGLMLIFNAVILSPTILAYLYAPIPEDSVVRTVMVVLFWVSGLYLTVWSIMAGRVFWDFGNEILEAERTANTEADR